MRKYNDKQAANSYITNRVRTGEIIRPEVCEKCGQTGPTHAHHYRGYSKRYRGTVQWLCALCHGAAGKKTQGNGAPDEVQRIMTRIALTGVEYRTLRIIAIDKRTSITDLIGEICRDWLRAEANKVAAPLAETTVKKIFDETS